MTQIIMFISHFRKKFSFHTPLCCVYKHGHFDFKTYISKTLFNHKKFKNQFKPYFLQINLMAQFSVFRLVFSLSFDSLGSI